MLGEFTGVLQLCTCVMIVTATFIWLKIIRHANKKIYEIRGELMKEQLKIGTLENQMRMLIKIMQTNHQIETVKETLADLHRKE